MAAMGLMDMLLWLANAGIVVGIVAAVLFFSDDLGNAFGLGVLCQCLIAFPVFSVMTIRASEETPFRPGGAKTLEQEFAAYGYPVWFYWLIRIVKPSCAVLLVLGLVFPVLALVGAAVIFVVMIGAVGSHIKVGDPLQASIPSFTLGCMCASLLFLWYCPSQTFGELPPGGKDILPYQPAFFNEWPARVWLCSFFCVVFVSMLATIAGPPETKDVIFWCGNGAIGVATLAAELAGYKDIAGGLMVVCQCLVAFAPFTVMTVRATQATPFRPGGAKTLKEEFEAYGYPSWFYWFIRIVKPLFAISLVVGLLPMITDATLVGAGGILVLMIGAVGSHVKVGDPIQKSVPSFTLGLMSICILATYLHGCTKITSHLLTKTPPMIYASESGRWTAFLSMSVVFAILVCQMVTSEMMTSKTAEAREALLSS
mmetsp:Transcript_70177/g.124911  ORF Transcript_70177/g.124911 Transcript_70177/m.124911 type:complete len:426 (-) Transcript_70177:66-1343(-)